MVDGRHIVKHHNSSAGCPIFAKFRKMTQNPTIITVDCKFQTLKLHTCNGRRSPKIVRPIVIISVKDIIRF